MKTTRVATAMLEIGMTMLIAGQVFSQNYPDKPIRIVTAPAGGGADFISRQVGQGISGALGQPVVVDNRASAVLAADVVSKSPPDGYSLLIGGASLWVFPLLQKMPYDIVNDFAPISLLVREVSLLVVHPSLPVNSVKELIALAKAKPGELNYSSATVGGSNHLAVELFKSMTGTNMTHVPYKGQTPAIAAVMSGEVQMTIIDAGTVSPMVKSGRLKALGVSSAEPSVLAPGMPTIASSGVPGYEAVSMSGIWAPAKVNAAIIARLNQEITRFLNRPEVKEAMLKAGEEVLASSVETFTATIKTDMARTAKVVKDAAIKIN